ncbi:orange carotenoid protein N-terminal domain-containing protein [Anabaena azotica]|uniref:Orange carotenoid protein n=1 Tax=Anabaena azotica FACHB-119 TaxID=947527 RepID=A0ABR8CZR8_9NOST|nr:orange carotenoid protein N-terminal domain-containing protein [Anabaena azotica]MBD2499446.1 orange carotenoid protein [Anabaena azotica FACHB-119]
MTASYDKNIAQAQTNATQSVVDAFNKLDTDAKLAWFYFVYEEMGESITPAAPAAAEPELAPLLLGNFFQLSHDEQLNIMRDIVNRVDTEYSRAYGALKENNQLLVWYVWAVAMGNQIVGMPDDYEGSQAVNDLLAQIQELEFEQQMSVFRTIAGEMGYSEVQPIETQAETGKTPSL